MPERKKNGHSQKNRRRGKASLAVDSDDLRHQMEATKACELRARGWTYKEIAGHLKCGTTHVADLLVMGLKRINEKHDVTVTQYREQEWAATQLLLDKYLPEALTGDAHAFERVMKLLERRAKYRGLDVVNHEDKSPIAGALNLNVETVNVGFVPKDQLRELLHSKIAEHKAAQQRSAAVLEHQPQSNEMETKPAMEEANEPPNEGID